MDFEASKTVLNANVPFFKNARVILLPTETCKAGPFTLTPDEIERMTYAPEQKTVHDVLVKSVQQWTELKRNDPQVVIFFDVDD